MSTPTAAEAAATQLLARLSEHYRGVSQARCSLRFTRSDCPGAEARYALHVRRPGSVSLVLEGMSSPAPEDWVPGCSLLIEAGRIVVVHAPDGSPARFSLLEEESVHLSASLMNCTPDTLLTPSGGRDVLMIATLFAPNPAALLASAGRPVYAGGPDSPGGSGTDAHRVMLIDDEEPAEQFRQELVVAPGPSPWLLELVTRWGAGLARSQGAPDGVVERVEFSGWSSEGVECAPAEPPAGTERVELLTPLLLPDEDAYEEEP